MSRAYSQGAKLRAKRAAMPDLAKTKSSKKKRVNGRFAMEEDPQATVLKARARQMGKGKPDDMRAPVYSDEAGRVLAMVYKEAEAKRIWQHYANLCTAESRYHRSLGKSIHAKTAKLEMTPERFESRADDRPDLRTEEQKDIDATRTWDMWLVHLSSIGLGNAAAIDTAKHGFAPLTSGGKPTSAGLRFAHAMRKLADVLDQSR